VHHHAARAPEPRKPYLNSKLTSTISSHSPTLYTASHCATHHPTKQIPLPPPLRSSRKPRNFKALPRLYGVCRLIVLLHTTSYSCKINTSGKLKARLKNLRLKVADYQQTNKHITAESLVFMIMKV
jgi:hypothetical protein